MMCPKAQEYGTLNASFDDLSKHWLAHYFTFSKIINSSYLSKDFFFPQQFKIMISYVIAQGTHHLVRVFL